MNTKLYEELSSKSDTVLRREYKNGEYALITFKEMLANDYISQDRYDRITKSNI